MQRNFELCSSVSEEIESTTRSLLRFFLALNLRLTSLSRFTYCVNSTVLAIAGDDYCLVAADTRQSEGYSINCRFFPKAHKLSNKTVLATAFMAADCSNLVMRLKQRMQVYQEAHNKVMSTTSIGQLISTMLYHKRFFPYYVFNVLGGLDEEGRGCVYSYDPVGNVERKTFTSAGSASSLIQPFLDNQVK